MSEPIFALSTMWSQGRFKTNDGEPDDMVAFAEKASGLGFRYAEINYVIPPAGVDALIECGKIAFSSVHSPCPRVKTSSGKMSDALNLASKNESERSEAVAVAKASVDTAVRAQAKYLVVHLGGIEHMFDEEKRLRKLYDEGAKDGEEVERLRASAKAKRKEQAPEFFPQARQSLAELAEYAAAKGVTIGLENRYHYHEFPDPDEMAILLAEYPPEVAGFWIDMGHTEVLDRLGLVPYTRWLKELSQRCVGSHVHDTDGLADHRAPGHGTADWEHYRSLLPPDVPRVYEINQKQPEEWVGAATEFLRGVGVLPAASA